jgi:CheY-like chemotaxis protein
VSSILVVDDEPGMRETLVDMLSDAGHEAESAADGDAALDRLRTESYDVVVMDIRMPGRDGVSVLEEIGRPPPQVILMTAYAVDEQLQRAAGQAFAVVHKPFPAPFMLGLVAQAAESAA